MTTGFKRLPHWLSGLLAVQLLLATGIFWVQQPHQGATAEPLLAEQIGDIDKLTITEGSDSTTLVKAAGQWHLADLNNLPANQDKVEQALEALSQQRLHFPVATQTSSHSRFEVAQDNAQRVVAAYSDDEKIAEIFLGTSPGLRQVHVRRAGEDAVYVAELNRFDFNGDNNGWLDRTLLATSEPVEISGKDFTLKKADDQWTLANAEDKPVDTGKVSELANGLKHLRIQSVADVDLSDVESTQLVVKASDQTKPVRYQLAKKDQSYYITRDDLEAVFKVSEFDFNRLHATDLSAFIANSDESKPAKEGQSES